MNPEREVNARTRTDEWDELTTDHGRKTPRPRPAAENEDSAVQDRGAVVDDDELARDGLGAPAENVVPDEDREYHDTEDRDGTNKNRDTTTSPGPTSGTGTDSEVPLELLPEAEVERFHTEWAEVQSRFIDDPHEAVERADRLVDTVLRSLTERLTDRRHELATAWHHDGGNGSGVDTEELRQALRGYRSLFNRVLNG